MSRGAGAGVSRSAGGDARQRARQGARRLRSPGGRHGAAARFALRFVLLPALAIGAIGTLPERARAQGQDTTKTADQRIRERLKSLGPLIRSDTVAADTTDTTTTQRVVFEGRGGAAARGGGILTPDSVIEALLDLRGYIATEYKAERAWFEADSGRLELRNNAVVFRQGTRVNADSTITFHEGTGVACATGNPVVNMEGGGAPISSDTLCYDTNTGIGTVRFFETEVSEGTTWRVIGDEARVLRAESRTGETEDRVYSHRAIFTDCDLEFPHYHFAARDMKVIRNSIMVARDVTLNFGEVPVFWLPFFVQSLTRGRRSGLLMPRFGINDIARTNARYSRRIEDIGFYLAISDHFGGEVAMDWQSDNWTALRGSLDYRFLRQFLSGALTFRRFWKSEGGRDFTLSTSNGWQPDERTRISVSANYATSTSFIRERSFDPRELNRSIASNAGLNRRFDWGTLSLSADRHQYLSDNSVRMTLPRMNLNISPVTLFEALPGQGRWYSNITWNGSASADLRRRDISEAQAPITQQDERELQANANNSLRVGRFSFSQSARLREREAAARDFDVDTLEALPRIEERTADWDMGFTYQQPLIGTSTLVPRLGLSGTMVRDSLDGEMVPSPMRIDFGASLNTAIYGFYGGIGPFERFRHRISPGVSYGYSPEPTVSARQERLFGNGVSERNQVTLTLTQTFEAKYRPDRDPQRAAPGGAAGAADTLGTDTLVAVAVDTSTGPRRRQAGRVIKLLSITTDALAYDFVRAREDGEGFQTTRIGNSMTSDVLPGMNFRIEHDLFEMEQVLDPEDPTTVIDTRRHFSPRLTNVSAQFSIGSDSWLARALRLGPGPDAPAAAVDTSSVIGAEPGGDPSAGPVIDQTQSEEGLIGTRRRQAEQAPLERVGTWRASLSYSMARPRTGDGNQMLTGDLTLQPTVNWSLSWRTGYSFTRGEFTDHVLTLTRRLHDFDANFDFFKAQNGNFAFQFRVHLRANPDLKLDYEQRDLPALPVGR